MVTIYDIAKKCGVSPSTVSKVVNNYSSIPEATKEKVLAVMKEMGYIPNSSAKQLSKGKSFNVGVLSYFGTQITPFKHSLFMDILDSFQSVINKKRYDLLFISRTVGENTGTFYQNCISRNVDGVLLLGEMNDKEMLEVIKSDIPSVGFDYVGELMSSVVSNNYNLAYELTKHLIDYNHKNIVYIAGDDNKITDLRIEAFKDCLINHGIEFHDDMLIKSKYVDLASLELIIDSIVNRKKRPTAIIFSDDISAIRGISLLQKYKLKCPNDISVVGFDGIEFGEIVNPPLTTAKQNTKKIGQTLAKLLLNAIEKNAKPESISIPGKVIIRNSTKKI
ncbi:MAG: LacI family DNA-binding transcriptional regulator [Acholeplasmatales bacterium]|nr:LacI family DNA-binding transcriptional regulator [Acholeplasmatales bacterium]